MKTEKEIREMLAEKRKQAKAAGRPDVIRRLDVACVLILEWVLDEKHKTLSTC